MAIRPRKLVVQAAVEPPACRAVAIAVIDNAYAGRYEAKLDPPIESGEELCTLLGKRCVEEICIAPGEAQSYGKLAIVGEAGEREHAAAILHPELGAPLRAAAEKGAAPVPSAKKIGTLGTAIDVPLAHKDALRLLRGLFRW
ncbi:amino acid synthesis family protein [Paraburkholderia sp. JPY169]|uniref:Amino acid synthesis family protein n=1 Tax=Paraburkholderia youngii TaxID=2782701 RepID=A0A7Y6MZ46_9BURK|nr:amino acid synthesis family protein [Paraburkholderia youngii]